MVGLWPDITPKLCGLIKHLSVHLPRKSLLTIFKSFIRPHLDYGNIIYNPKNELLTKKLKKAHYQPCLAITDAIQDTSSESLYQEFGLGSLQSRWWNRKMIFFPHIFWHFTNQQK